MLLAAGQSIRTGRILLLGGGVVGSAALVYYLGAGAIAEALARVTWWEFALICVVHGLSLGTDTLGWRFTLTGDAPPFRRLLAAKCAGEAVNLVTALGAIGGEAVKAWLLRGELPYRASVPSLILAKTALVIGQTLLMATALVVAWTTGTGGITLQAAMGAMLVLEAVGVGGFVAVQTGGLVGRAGRVLSWAGLGGLDRARLLDQSLRGFYRRHRPALLASVVMHFAGCLLGALEALLILRSLDLSASFGTSLVVEALGSGVRFLTFFVPASLGALEGANVAAFRLFGWVASAGLAFTLVRRARQVVWIGLGVALLVVMGAGRASAPSAEVPLSSTAD